MDEGKTNMLNEFLPQLKNFVKAETVFGEPYTLGEITLIPVNSVKVGFGYGNSGITKNTDTTGGGGGVLLTPVAFIVIKGDDVNIHSLNSGAIENVMDKFPGVVEKLGNLFQKFQQKKQSPEE
ncbi:MAG: sporulation protein [SAR324 cluster bacterium]|uniref:Sporulation protein n=1 Tax=SAR324 cluster bacterium TaxID=2024889 RepID=A0A2A4T2X8_9DELT|nr:MAG: sporulation protein [SAR324 cluster bacterium]